MVCFQQAGPPTNQKARRRSKRFRAFSSDDDQEDVKAPRRRSTSGRNLDLGRSSVILPRMSLLMWLLVIFLVLSVAGGGYGHSAGWGYASWSPAGILLVVLIILLLTRRF